MRRTPRVERRTLADVCWWWEHLDPQTWTSSQGSPLQPPGAPPGGGPHLSHVLQQADVDGDQA